MALGGGTFTNYNKVLPGTYINFVSAAGVSNTVGDRGVCAAAMKLSWGEEGAMIRVSAEDFMKDSMKYFGCAYSDSTMGALRDIFMNASVVYVYRLGKSVKAGCSIAEAKYGGICGNKIKISVSKNIDNGDYYDVVTYYRSLKKDVQTVKNADELKDNDYVVWKKGQTLNPAASINLTGGSDAVVTGSDYQGFLDAAESVRFNVLTTLTMDKDVNNLIAAYTRRMREEQGVKFQSVLYRCEADDIGVINVDTSAAGFNENQGNLVWFVAGLAAGCPINKSLTNRVYNGSFKISDTYTQSELENCIKSGKFVVHNVDGEYRVLKDINSLVNLTGDMSEAFCENQTVRILDQIAYDDAKLFKSKYLGIVPNDEAGRVSLWSDIVEHRRSLQRMRAIENFNDDDVKVEKGNSKTSVVISGSICPINSMTKLYITTTVE